MGNNHKFMLFFSILNPLLKNVNSFHTVWIVFEKVSHSELPRESRSGSGNNRRPHTYRNYICIMILMVTHGCSMMDSCLLQQIRDLDSVRAGVVTKGAGGDVVSARLGRGKVQAAVETYAAIIVTGVLEQVPV